jgi:hypothetical protein
MRYAAHIQVALEIGPKRRVFAQALAWPGWCRSGKSEEAALANLLALGERYTGVAKRAGLTLVAPTALDQFVVVERVIGTAVTDFGGLSTLFAHDTEPLEDEEIEQLTNLLNTCWMVFDEHFQAIPAEQRDLLPERGRSPNAIRWHVIETDQLHASAFGAAVRPGTPTQADRLELQARQHIRAGLQAVPRHNAATPHRRSGFTWTPRFAIRRSAWHALDHAWQLQGHAS